MNEKFWQWVMVKLAKKFLIPNWLFPSHVSENAGIPIPKEDWEYFLIFVNESTIDDEISERIDELYLLFEMEDGS